MTDETENGAAGQADAQPVVHCHSQYVKDLSFENPNAADAALSNENEAPNVDMNVQIQARALRPDLYEVSLTVEGKAVRGDKHVFVAELDYAGLFVIQNVPKEHLEPVLYIHCPTLLFPFARQVLAEVTRNGGYPPLLLNPVDFAQLYQQQTAQRQPGNGGDATA